MRVIVLNWWTGAPTDWLYDETNDILYVLPCSSISEEKINEIQKNEK